MTNKRVGIVLPRLQAGGVGSLFLGVANCLQARGYDVDLVLLSLVGDYRQAIPSNVNVFGSTFNRTDPDFCRFLHQHRNLSYLRLPRFNLLYKRLLYRFLLRHAIERPRKFQLARDAEVVSQYIAKRGPCALLSGPAKANYAMLLGSQSLFKTIRTVVTVHSNYALARDAKLQDWSRLLYPKADWVVGVSRGAAECAKQILQLPAHKVTHIYNGFNLCEIQKQADDRNSQGYKLQQFDGSVVLSVGRLASDEAKDFDTLIKAFAIIRRKFDKIKLVLLCPGNHDGTQMERLQPLCAQLSVEDDVTFLNFDENPFSYMKHASMLVLSSRWEGFGNVLVEAMACGTPVISTDCPFGPAEILDGGEFGQLVPVGGINQMADAMINVLHGISGGGGGLRARAADFSIERTADEYEKLLFGTQ